jgi:hypothetical protein
MCAPFQYQNVPKIAELNDKTKQIKKDLHSQIFKDFARCAPPTTCCWLGHYFIFILFYFNPRILGIFAFTHTRRAA